MAQDTPRLICVIGAECTGKTSLVHELAAELGASAVPEVLRDWCSAHGRTPRVHEQAALMQAQIHKENQAIAQVKPGYSAIVLCDTAPLLTALYSMHYFADSSLLAPAQAHHRRYALTLWLQPDLPWVADGLQRDGQAAQAAVHAMLAQQLALQSNVVRIVGCGPARLQAARSAVLARVSGL
ncbi:ATP-binding protein [Rhodoferax sp.]|uniref:ATP-binding protein n=1 Tax=Rhodoferax sp. TaxID=50421 RepID=UPI0028475F84|nr:ATP-binding protein [Rhodoferax sp.]MDR3371283.1 ATP-binding protein [Rhodoferax sp.]